MRKIVIIILLNIIWLALCKPDPNPERIMQKTIDSIDKIKSISYNQHLIRTNPRNPDKIIKRDRSFLYKKLKGDSITGAKTHINYYSEGVIVYEDIYDGNHLMRINYYDSTAGYYDLIKYPEIKRSNRFWRKNSPYTIQALLNFTLQNKNEYTIEQKNDTIIDHKACYSIKTTLYNKSTFPGFNHNFIKSLGNIECSYYYINKHNYFPLKIRFEQFAINNPQQIYFTDHQFYDIVFNPDISDDVFTSPPSKLKGFKINYVNRL